MKSIVAESTLFLKEFLQTHWMFCLATYIFFTTVSVGSSLYFEMLKTMLTDPAFGGNPPFTQDKLSLLVQMSNIVITIGKSCTYTVGFGYFLFHKLNPGAKAETLWGYSNRIAIPWFLESLETLGRILLMSLLLIVPGMMTMIRLYWVTPIVLADASYNPKSGLSAVQISKQTSNGNFWLYFCLVVLTCIPVAIQTAWAFSPLNALNALPDPYFTLTYIKSFAVDLLDLSTVVLSFSGWIHLRKISSIVPANKM